MSIQINRITNANIYLDGGTLLGRAEEIKLPDIGIKMTEHKALGMVGTIELPAGFDKMEGEIKWSSFYPDVMAKAANPFKFLPLQVRSDLATYNSKGLVEQVPMVSFLNVIFKKIPGGTFKQHDNAEFAKPFAAYYFKQVVNGEDLFEFDPMANIYKVKGEDLLVTYRKNIG